MKIAVCVKPGRNGEISPFEMSAYEMALSVSDAEISLFSMAPISAKDNLLMLSRLGAKNIYLISDSSFAGSDTVATSYILSEAIKRVSPDIIICGRKTMEGDTAQIPPMLAEYLNLPYYSEILSLSENGSSFSADSLSGKVEISGRCVISAEKSLILRRPRIGSVIGKIEIVTNADLSLDKSKIGLCGSPTRVIETKENEAGRRKCKFLDLSEFQNTVSSCIRNAENESDFAENAVSENKLNGVICIGEGALVFGKAVSDSPEMIPEESTIDSIISVIENKNPSAVLFPATKSGREKASRIAIKLHLGLCADCTALSTDGNELFMIRPALSGSVIAKIKSLTRPALCTVRTKSDSAKQVFVSLGYGAKNELEYFRSYADSISAELASSRKMVDSGITEYKSQVGLTGKVVSPDVYIAIGVSGAVHHIVGMDRSRFVIAVNPDKNAPIFDYADFGFLSTAEELKELLSRC